MKELNDRRFYVYELCYPDGTPFYVGRGSNNRISFHEREALKVKKVYSKKDQIIREIIQQGNSLIAKIVHGDCLSEESFEKEKELISQYKRVGEGGILINVLEGGRGGGKDHTEAIRKFISYCSKEVWKTSERQEIKPDKEKIRKTLKEFYKNNPEIRKSTTAKATATLRTSEHRAKARETTIEQMKDPAMIKKLSDSSKRLHKDPEWKKRNMEAQRKSITPEYRKKMSDIQKKLYAEGKRQVSSKLNSEDVKDIRYLFNIEKVPVSKLMLQFGVTAVCLYNVINYKTWKHVE